MLLSGLSGLDSGLYLGLVVARLNNVWWAKPSVWLWCGVYVDDDLTVHLIPGLWHWPLLLYLVSFVCFWFSDILSYLLLLACLEDPSVCLAPVVQSVSTLGPLSNIPASIPILYFPAWCPFTLPFPAWFLFSFLVLTRAHQLEGRQPKCLNCYGNQFWIAKKSRKPKVSFWRTRLFWGHKKDFSGVSELLVWITFWITPSV